MDVFCVASATVLCGIGGSFAGYYCYVCICIKICFAKFVLKSKTLISQCDYKKILGIHDEISQAMALANKFLSYPAFVTVLCNMFGLFFIIYNFVFYPSDDIEACLLLIYGIIQNVTALLLMLIPAAGCNRASNVARNTIKSLPGFLPQYRKILKMYIQRHSEIISLTLWNIYVIDESLVISAFGTLLTYGFFIGSIKIAKE
ncbi:uncharacterized protein NPIL_572191 [Nephila pilipes]|uniref:Uncharacterized protein n=1 Tax=Nephila pilipes TaxID=299642 RepID=A0A8X6N8S0_NEPPI|nr:uncharacterized protein NPIL_572191 [Nephila pilipes]